MDYNNTDYNNTDYNNTELLNLITVDPTNVYSVYNNNQLNLLLTLFLFVFLMMLDSFNNSIQKLKKLNNILTTDKDKLIKDKKDILDEKNKIEDNNKILEEKVNNLQEDKKYERRNKELLQDILKDVTEVLKDKNIDYNPLSELNEEEDDNEKLNEEYNITTLKTKGNLITFINNENVDVTNKKITGFINDIQVFSWRQCLRIILQQIYKDYLSVSEIKNRVTIELRNPAYKEKGYKKVQDCPFSIQNYSANKSLEYIFELATEFNINIDYLTIE